MQDLITQKQAYTLCNLEPNVFFCWKIQEIKSSKARITSQSDTVWIVYCVQRGSVKFIVQLKGSVTAKILETPWFWYQLCCMS